MSHTTFNNDSFDLAVIKHLCPEALLNEKLSPLQIFERGWKAATANMQSKVDEVKQEEDVSYNALMMVSKLLAQIAITIKGEELPLQAHSYHDLPELVDELKQDAEAFKVLANMPSLWTIKLMFGPYFKFSLIRGTSRSEDIEVSEHVTSEGRTLALRNLIKNIQSKLRS